MNKNFTSNLDDFDLAILRILQRDNTTPQRRIGEAVNLSTPSVQRRIRRMEREGIIAANVACIDPEKVNLPLTMIVEVTLTNETTKDIEAIKRLFSDTPQVQQCYYVTGEVDFVLVMVVSGMGEYEALTHNLFIDNDIVRKFRTLIAMDGVKTGLTLPI